MIEYRSFRNTDPPQLVSLWHAGELGRGAASGFSVDAFETLIFSNPYFDRHGLIIAADEGRVIGFAHAGFGSDPSGSQLSLELGSVCAVLVAPEYRRRGIGRELVNRAERYLTDSGATSIVAGPAEPRNPFYVGLYGGVEPSGFLQSDPNAAPFLTSLGYESVGHHAVFQRSLQGQADPVNFRIVGVRRKMETIITPQPENASWWWLTRYGRLDALRFLMVPKGGGDPVAAVTVVGLDFYLAKWQERSIGILDLFVADSERRKGYGQALVVEVCRRLREELVTRVEAHAPQSDPMVTHLLESVGFAEVDSGIVYLRKSV